MSGERSLAFREDAVDNFFDGRIFEGEIHDLALHIAHEAGDPIWRYITGTRNVMRFSSCSITSPYRASVACAVDQPA